MLRSLELYPGPHYLQPGGQPFPGDLRGHSMSLFSELVDWASIPAIQMILPKPIVNPDNLYYDKTGLCNSAFTSQCTLKRNCYIFTG